MLAILLSHVIYLSSARAEVEEAKEIDFKKVKEHLEQGESVFITPKRKEKVETSLVERENAAETWYFTHL
ncbi:MAG: hypothetical protein OEW95_08740 [Candidatus Bathyarchaeota archaeon]|nr:hypothetical protein [Candidatus Bathyarchaeota archaeon]